MLQKEFEERVGRRVSTDDYYNIFEPLYMKSTLDKDAFCKAVKPIVRNMPRVEDGRYELVMGVKDNSGCYMTPNLCYYHTVRVAIDDVDIRRRKVHVTVLPNTYEMRYEVDFYEDDPMYVVKR